MSHESVLDSPRRQRVGARHRAGHRPRAPRADDVAPAAFAAGGGCGLRDLRPVVPDRGQRRTAATGRGRRRRTRRDRRGTVPGGGTHGGRSRHDAGRPGIRRGVGGAVRRACRVRVRRRALVPRGHRTVQHRVQHQRPGHLRERVPVHGVGDGARPVRRAACAGAGMSASLRPPRNQVSPRAVWWWLTRTALIVLPLPLALLLLFVVVPPARPVFGWLTVAFGAPAVVWLVVEPWWRWRVHRWEVTVAAGYVAAGWPWPRGGVVPL